RRSRRSSLRVMMKFYRAATPMEVRPLPHATGIYPGCVSLVCANRAGPTRVGGGGGWGVAKNGELSWDTPLPDPPPQGGRERRDRARGRRAERPRHPARESLR